MNSAAVAKSFQSARTLNFNESVIREMTRIAARAGATNLAQGFPDFPSPPELKAAAIAGITGDHNQYSITWGAKPFRDAVARKYMRTYGFEADPEREITACCGSTEGMIAALLAVTNPGDEVIVFEPFYENYHPDTLLCGVERRVVKLRAPDWSFDPEELRAAFSARTAAIIVNTPNNPTGKVFSREEIACIAELCQEFDALAITDEIYEHIIYDGQHHIPMITMPGMRDRSILVNSMSKTFSVTGWRVGWVIAAPHLTDTIRKVHDFLTVHAPTPLQYAGVIALDLPDTYFNGLAAEYDHRRQIALKMLAEAGFECSVPGGAYYIMADAKGLGVTDDREFALWLVDKVGVAGVPGSSFYSAGGGTTQLRFCFCKTDATLHEAGRKLAELPRLIGEKTQSTTR
jgi:aspartate/methionine/tyrosine aminotransferase